MLERIVAVAGHPRWLVIEPHAAHLLQTAGRTSADVVTYCEQELRDDPPDDPTCETFLLYEVGPEIYVYVYLNPDRLLLTTLEDAEPRIRATLLDEDEDSPAPVLH